MRPPPRKNQREKTMLNIGGYQKTTLLDYPGKLAATVFIGGCNFRCPFCHNSELFAPEELYDEEELLSIFKKRRGVLEGIAITGGEPTLQAELPDFMRKIKELGLLEKLDSNGYRPEVLRSLIEEGLVDYIAMDIKNSPEHYGETAGFEKIDMSRIEESAQLLKTCGIDHEFRTTVVPELHAEEDFEAIGRWLAGPDKYFLQGYRDSDMVYERRFSQPAPQLMRQIREIVLPYLPNTQIRGVD